MRFEDLPYPENRKNLERLHRRLNKVIYNGTLSDRIIYDIENLENAYGCYFTARLGDKEKKGISFSHEMENLLKAAKSAQEQVYLAANVMLHEMAHQYCDESGIDDIDHGKKWREVAREHGFNITDTPEDMGELNTCGMFAVRNFRWRHAYERAFYWTKNGYKTREEMQKCGTN